MTDVFIVLQGTRPGSLERERERQTEIDIKRERAGENIFSWQSIWGIRITNI